MGNHTPGPWRFQQDGNEPYWGVGMPHTDGSGRYGAYNAMVYTTEEDARLIAAAPELLSALRRLVEYCDSHNDYDAIGEAVQAIAKAEGRAE